MLILLLPLLALLCAAAVVLRRSRPGAARHAYRAAIAAAVLPYLLHVHHTRGYVTGFGEPEVPLGAYAGVQAYTAASLAAATVALAAGWWLAARAPFAAALMPAALWVAYRFACLPLLYWRAPGFVHLDNVPLVWLFAISALATVLLAAAGWALRRRPVEAPPAGHPWVDPADMRARYPDAARCTNVAGGERCAPEHISIRSMNFGQHWRTEGIEDVAYEVELPLAYVVDLLREQLPEYVDDSRAHPDPDSDIDRALDAAGWPDADGVLAIPTLRDAFLDFYGYELLLRWFGDGPPDREPGYVLNTVERIEVAEERVVFRGTARRSGLPVRYQDV